MTAVRRPLTSTRGRLYKSKQTATLIFASLRAAAPADIVARWEARHEMERKTTTVAYQKTIRTFLALCVLQPPDRVDIMMALADTLAWDPSTTAKYWLSCMAGMKMLGLPMSPLDKTCTKNLERMARAKIPDLPTLALMPQDAISLTATLNPMARMVFLIIYLLGQRTCDALHLTKSSFTLVTDEVAGTEYWSITFYEGKTVGRLQPYSLHLPTISQVGELIRTWLQAHSNDNLDPLIANEIRENLRGLRGGQYNLLSLRKGACSGWRRAGCQTPTF